MDLDSSYRAFMRLPAEKRAAVMHLALMVTYRAPQYVAVEAVCDFLRWAA